AKATLAPRIAGPERRESRRRGAGLRDALRRLSGSSAEPGRRPQNTGAAVIMSEYTAFILGSTASWRAERGGAFIDPTDRGLRHGESVSLTRTVLGICSLFAGQERSHFRQISVVGLPTKSHQEDLIRIHVDGRVGQLEGQIGENVVVEPGREVAEDILCDLMSVLIIPVGVLIPSGVHDEPGRNGMTLLTDTERYRRLLRRFDEGGAAGRNRRIG